MPLSSELAAILPNFKEELMASMKQDILQGWRNTPTSTTPVGPYGHGPGGLFNQIGQDPQVFSAILAPVNGLIGEIPVRNAQDDSGTQFGGNDAEFFSCLTGVTQGAADLFANQPTVACADGARSGLMKVCTLLSPFGRYRFAPNMPVDIFRAGQRASLADPITLQLMNNPSLAGGGFSGPGASGFGMPTATKSWSNALLNELARRMLEMGITAQRMMMRRVFIGSPANNNGEARDILGLDLMINSGNHVDAYTQNNCTALDSNLMDFGFNAVNGPSTAYDVQKYAEAMILWLDWNAERMGLDSEWNGWIVMRPDLWDELTKVINVRQFQEVMAQANVFTNGRVVVDPKDAIAMRNEMRVGRQWPLRGRMIPVVLDMGITESTPVTQSKLTISGSYASDIYFVNKEAAGVPTTYWKFFDHNNENSAAIEKMTAQQSFTSDAGMFRWYLNHKNGCVDLTVDFSPRLIVRCPQLCGRIQNVAYIPPIHLRDVDPTSSYFADGGRTTGANPTFYSPWSTTTPSSGGIS